MFGNRTINKLCLIVSLAASASAFSIPLKISTFNIRWYGQPRIHKLVPFGFEYRDQFIRDYIYDEIQDADVIVFQEIVKPERLEEKVLGNDMKCVTYEHASASHMHVVLCHKPEYRFIRQPDDDNYAIESVAGIGSSARPALYGILIDDFGNYVAHIIGLHLKAFPKESEKRMYQTERLAERLEELEVQLPMVVLGDMNSFPAEQTGGPDDDDILMDDIFSSYGLGLMQVDNPYEYTYRTPQRGGKFDRIWVSEEIDILESLEVGRPCNEETFGIWDDIAEYNRKVSDHCPVTVTLDVPES